MTNDLLEYPQRHYGMDHDRYEWSMLQDREPVTWPGGKPLALWINISVQHFPLSGDKPAVAPPGALTMPYPDLRHYTLRDYGNRVGIYRLLKLMAEHEASPSLAISGALAERHPHLLIIDQAIAKSPLLLPLNCPNRSSNSLTAGALSAAYASLFKIACGIAIKLPPLRLPLALR